MASSLIVSTAATLQHVSIDQPANRLSVKPPIRKTKYKEDKFAAKNHFPK